MEACYLSLYIGMYLTQDRDQGQALVNKVMNLQVP
jgi:hypothetical protein